MMVRTMRFTAAAFTAFTLYALAPASIGATQAEAAVVYCKAVGVPKGCVVRPTRAVVYCTAVGVPKGCVVRPVTPVVVAPVVRAPVVVAPVVVAPRVVVRGVGAPGVGVAPGQVGNRGGPVNRAGRR